MRYFRSNMTRLKQKMEEKLPADDDIFEYPGINKALLVDAVQLAYDISQDIQARDNDTRFEIIALKRYGSEAYKFLVDYLDKIDYSSAKRKFDDFLNTLSTLVEKTKITYFIVTKNALRDDQEISILQERIANYKSELEKLSEIKSSYEDQVGQIEEKIGQIEIWHEEASKKANELVQWVQTSEEHFNRINSVYENIEGWDESIQGYELKIKGCAEKYDELIKKSEKLKEQLNLHVDKGIESCSNLKEYEENNKRLLDEINETLGDANRVGMSASFLERKVELRWQHRAWGGIFLLAVISISLLSFTFVLPEVKQPNIDWKQVLFKIAFISPLVWLGWFAVKQYGYLSRIREDYAFKYASSMAYEGHKKATREVDESLERVLLEFTMYNMSQNPIRLYSKTDRETPIQEFFDSILGKLPNLKKVKAKTPYITSVEVTGEGTN